VWLALKNLSRKNMQDLGRTTGSKRDVRAGPFEKKAKEMSARAGAKECRLGAGVMDMAFPFQLLFRKRRGEVRKKDWASARNANELVM
jgi:hypothetical protein